MRIHRILFTLFLGAALPTILLSQYNDYNAIYLGTPYRAVQRYFYDVAQWGARQPDSRLLGSNVIGYDMGRYGLHGLLWYHKAWERTPEYAAAGSDQKLQYLRQIKNKIDTLTNDAYFRDVSLCAQNAFKGSTRDGIGKFADGYKGWGFERSFDANVPLPGGSIKLQAGAWYRFRVRCENIGTQPLNRISVWFAPSGQPLPAAPYYVQTYQGTTWDEDNGSVVQVLDAAGNVVRSDHGSVALLSAFSNSSFRNVVVYTGTGSSRSVFYDLNSRAALYASQPAVFHSEWRKIGWSDAGGSDTLVWSFSATGGQNVISCAAADPWSGLMPLTRRTSDNKGVYAAAVLNYDTLGVAGIDLQDCEIEYEVQIGKRTTGYAESGMAFHWINPPPDGQSPAGGGLFGQNYTGVSSTMPGYQPYMKGESFYQSTEAGDPINVPYFTHRYRYLAALLSPDVLRVVFHRDTEPGGYSQFFGATPWDTGNTLDPDSLVYNESHAYEGEMTGAVLRFAHYVEDSATPPDVKNAFGQDAESYIGRLDANTIAKWIQAAGKESGTNALLYGATRSQGLQSFGNFTDAHIFRYMYPRTAGLFQFTRYLNSQYAAQAGSYMSTFLSDLGASFREIRRPGGCSSWTWFEGIGWWGTFNDGYTDFGHTGPSIRMLALEYDLTRGESVRDMLLKMRDALVKNVWNNQTSPSAINLYSIRNGTGNFVANGGSGATDDWVLLSSVDFQAWEIMDAFYTRYPDLASTVFGNAAAEMLYAVRYGIPRNVKMTTIRGCGGNGYVLRWDAPSDFPIGRDGRPGTRLRYYNVYKRASADNGRSWSDWYRAAQIAIHTESTTVQGIQDDFDYPFWSDPSARPDSLYSYMVRTQDWSVGITNESFNSVEVQVQYPAAVAAVQVPRRTAGVIEFTGSSILIRANVSFDGIWFVPRDLVVDNSVTLTVQPDAVVCFARGTQLLVRGDLRALDDLDDCWITFQGEEDTPGCWKGITMSDLPPMSNHYLYHCRIKNGVKNMTIFNDESRLEMCDIYGASENGVWYERGSSHIHQNNQIHDNGKTNLVIKNPGTRVTIQSDVIQASGTEDGIAIFDGACPTITECTVSGNARHGISLWSALDPTGLTMPRILQSTVSNNGTAGMGDGIMMYNTEALVRLNGVVANRDAGIGIYANSELRGGSAPGEAGMNSISGNAINLRAVQSGGTFGVSNPKGGSVGHQNCFIQPTTLQIQALNGTVLSAEEDFYNPNGTNWFVQDNTSYVFTTNPLAQCGPSGGPIVARAGDEATAAAPLTMFAKASGTDDIRSVAQMLGARDSAGAKSMVKQLIDRQDAAVGDELLTLSYAAFRLTRDRSILARLDAAVRQGRCDRVKGALLAAACYRDLGMYSKALGLLTPLGDIPSTDLRRGVEVEKAHLALLLNGPAAAKSAASRLAGMFPGDKLVEQIAGYLPFVGQRQDVPDTLAKENAPSSTTAAGGYALGNYPNPCNPQTVIQYTIPEDSRVRLSIVDAMGRESEVLTDETQRKGTHQALFDASRYPSGVYVCRMSAGETTLTRKIAVVK